MHFKKKEKRERSSGGEIERDRGSRKHHGQGAQPEQEVRGTERTEREGERERQRDTGGAGNAPPRVLLAMERGQSAGWARKAAFN